MIVCNYIHHYHDILLFYKPSSDDLLVFQRTNWLFEITEKILCIKIFPVYLKFLWLFPNNGIFSVYCEK